MKNRIIFTLLLLIMAAGGLVSCKKSNTKDDPCSSLNLTEKAMVNYSKPCGLAISKSGIVAVVQYNGFTAYGSDATTGIWSSFSDFMAGKAPVQTFTSRGAEAAAFDNNENLYITETEGTAGIVVYKRTMQINGWSYVRAIVIQGKVTGGFVNPRGIAFDSENRLYIANDGRGNIVRITDPANNGPQQIICADLNGIKGLAITGSTLYATMYNDNAVFKITLKPNGDFNELVSSFTVQHPVDIAVKEGMLAIGSPDGLLTLIDPAQIQPGKKAYTGCKKEISTGKNLFGLAFNPAGPELAAACLDQNKALIYKPQ